ncbi:MAG: hypothetical protein AAGA96_10170 [Verrucomicrobiota bacterium]
MSEIPVLCSIARLQRDTTIGGASRRGAVLSIARRGADDDTLVSELEKAAGENEASRAGFANDGEFGFLDSDFSNTLSMPRSA